ncbi:MAG: hypothetical protein AAGH64_05190 [Planctomycetota bacterium]
MSGGNETRTPDGSLTAAFDRDGETFWWTVYPEGQIDGNDLYSV